MKTIATLLVLLAAIIGLLAQAPPTTEAEREATTRRLLDLIYAQRDKTNAASTATSAVPVRLNTATNTLKAATDVVANPVPGATPAPAATTAAAALPVPGAAVAPGAVTPPARATNRAPRAFPALPAFPVPGGANPQTATPANPATATATPILPGTPNAAAPAANVNAAVAPGIANAAGANAAAGAKPANPEDEVFPPGLIKFSEADLSQVLEIYQELTGRTVLKPANLPAAKITIRSQTQLTRAEAVQALDSILSMNQITMVPQGEKFVKAVPQGQANTEGNRFSELPWELLPESGTIVTYVVQLTNAVPQEVATVLAQFGKMQGNSIIAIPSTSMLVIRDYAENVKRMLEMIQKIDVTAPQEFQDVVIPIKYALAGDIAQVLSSLTAGGGGGATTVGRQQTRSGLTSGGAGGFGGAGGAGGAGGFGGQPGYNPNNQFGQQQQGGALGTGGLGGGAAGRSSFANRLNQIVNRAAGASGSGGDIFVLGQTKIIADERTNSLLIFASKSDLHTISNIIDKLDVVLAQVVIEAVILEVNLGNKLNYGFSYLQTKPGLNGNVLSQGAFKNIPFLDFNAFNSGASNALGGGFSYVARYMDLEATVTALSSDNRGRVLQRPRIQTSHAVEANLFIGESRPYPSSYSGGGGLYGAYSSIQQLQIGVTLSVLPLINHDGLVVMDIRQKIESASGTVSIANVGDVPITSQKEANAKVAVRDRETVMLGGFISNEKSQSGSGIPILKDIPVLGSLFRTSTHSDNRNELIVLIRPTVLPSPKDAAIFASDERRRMPATAEAERTFTESERKLLEKTNKKFEKEDRKLLREEGFTH